jgi:hypothetical protein
MKTSLGTSLVASPTDGPALLAHDKISEAAFSACFQVAGRMISKGAGAMAMTGCHLPFL